MLLEESKVVFKWLWNKLAKFSACFSTIWDIFGIVSFRNNNENNNDNAGQQLLIRVYSNHNDDAIEKPLQIDMNLSGICILMSDSFRYFRLSSSSSPSCSFVDDWFGGYLLFCSQNVRTFKT